MKRLRDDRFVELLLLKFRPRRHGATGTDLQMVLFRRYLNTTPGEYRRSSRQKNADGAMPEAER